MALTLEDYKAMQSFEDFDHLEPAKGAGADRTKLARVRAQIYSFEGGGKEGAGGWKERGVIPAAIYAEMGNPKDSEGDGEEGDGGVKPPSFPSTGPVFTPLDLTAPNQNPYYSYNYPDYAPDTGANFQSQGLLTENIGYGASDPYQPWSQQYGNEYFLSRGGENLWNYQPPSIGDKPFNYDLSKGPGPKVGFAK